MSGSWAGEVGATLMLLAAAASAGRLIWATVSRTRTDRAGDASHLVMALAMAAMLHPTARAATAPWLWTPVFGGSAVAFALSSLGRGPLRVVPTGRPGHLAHAAANAAMAFMVSVMSGPWGPPAAAAMGPGRSMPVAGSPAVLAWLALATFLYLVFAAARCSVQLAAQRTGRGGGRRTPDTRLRRTPARTPAAAMFTSPVLPVCCELAMSVAMAAAVLPLV